MKPFSTIPTPKSLPILGHALDFAQATRKGKIHELIHKWYKELGPVYRIKIVNDHMVVVTDPELIEGVMRKAMENGGRPAVIEIEDNVIKERKLQASISTTDYDQWKRTRPLVNILLQPQLVNQLIPRISTIAQEWSQKVKEWSTKQNDGSYVLQDLKSTINFYTLETIVAVTIGKKLGLTEVGKKEDPDIIQYMSAVEGVIRGIAQSVTSFPMWKYIKTSSYKTFEHNYVYAYDYAKKIRNNLTSTPIKDCEDGITHLSSVYTALGEKMNLSKDEILAVDTGATVAGVDTTSAVATTVLYELAINPSLQDQIFEEICSVMGLDGATSLPPIENNQLKKMVLLKNFVKDAIRKSPTAATNFRLLFEDTELSGYHIPKNTPMLLFNYGVNRDEKYFENPLQVNPHRFSNEENKINEYSMLLFGLGERSCPGKRLAMAEVYLLAAHVIYQFKLQCNAKDYDMFGYGIIAPEVNDTNRIHFVPRS